jgi:hypothetical protein
VAALLEAESKVVMFLGLIDPFIPLAEQAHIDDWQKDFCDFVSAVIPGVKADEVIRKLANKGNDVDASENGQSVSDQVSIRITTGLLEYFISKQAKAHAKDRFQTGAEDYADMGAEELARIFSVARHLEAISSRALGLNPLRVRPICWWVAERPISDRLALASQIKQDKLHSAEINADHFGIVRSKSLLLILESALMGMTAVSHEEMAHC